MKNLAFLPYSQERNGMGKLIDCVKFNPFNNLGVWAWTQEKHSSQSFWDIEDFTINQAQVRCPWHKQRFWELCYWGPSRIHTH